VAAGVWAHKEGPADAVRAFNRVFAETPVGSALVLPSAT
jgi:hypothetical protein